MEDFEIIETQYKQLKSIIQTLKVNLGNSNKTLSDKLKSLEDGLSKAIKEENIDKINEICLNLSQLPNTL